MPGWGEAGPAKCVQHTEQVPTLLCPGVGGIFHIKFVGDPCPRAGRAMQMLEQAAW